MRWKWQIGVLAVVVSAAVTWAVRTRTTFAPSRPAALPPSLVREQDIAFYQARVKRDPYGARDLAMLGSLFLARARETGSYEDILRAERAARESYGHRRRRNDGAAALLASALLAEHRFTEAYQVASALAASDSTEPTSRAMLGEIALELGRYDEAGRLFSTLSTQRYAPALAPRFARWLELQGKPAEAIDLLRSVRQTLAGGFRVPAEQLAWIDLRIGDMALRAGRLDEAQRAFASGLSEAPDDYRLLGAQARLEAARGHWSAAIENGERAIAVSLDPATLGLLSDCYAAEGDSAKAAEFARAMEISVSQQPGAFHRAWSLFLLKHDRDIPQVLSKAETELRDRKDVYGYDLVAWALHKSGRDQEAAQLAAKALSLGTRDAMLYWHAGQIAAALGDSALSRVHLATAKEINPYYRP